MEFLKQISSRACEEPVAAAMLAAGVVVLAMIARLMVRRWETKAGASKESKMTKKKRERKTKEELLMPFERKMDVPEMSLEELAAAKEKGALLIGGEGRVFDVSTNEGFYGKEGSYHLFVGKDASVALAKMKFNAEFLDPSQLHWKRDLDEKEHNILQDWLERFENKYKLVGYIKDDGKLKR